MLVDFPHALSKNICILARSVRTDGHGVRVWNSLDCTESDLPSQSSPCVFAIVLCCAIAVGMRVNVLLCNETDLEHDVVREHREQVVSTHHIVPTEHPSLPRQATDEYS